MFVGILMASATASECEAPTTNTELLQVIDRALDAYRSLEVDTFRERIEQANAKIPCMGDPIAFSTAAAFHRVTGLAQFLDRDLDRAKRSFGSARALEPEYNLPVDLVPEGNPIREVYTTFDLSGPTELLPEVAIGVLRLDGHLTMERPVGRPVIAQWTDASGAMALSAYLGPDEPLPAMAVPEAVPKPSPTGGEAPPEKRHRGRGPLLAGAGLSLLAAGGLFAGATVSRAAYDGDGTTLDNADARKSTTNALVIGSGVAGVAAIGLGTTSLLVSGRF